MQKQVSKEIKKGNGRLRYLLDRAQSGDNEAMMAILDSLEADINSLARYSRMNKEEFNQEIKTSFIELVRKGKIGL